LNIPQTDLYTIKKETYERDLKKRPTAFFSGEVMGAESGGGKGRKRLQLPKMDLHLT